MQSKVASTSIAAKRNMSVKKLMSQCDQVVEILKAYPTGTTRKHISFLSKKYGSYTTMDPSSVCGRVDELLTANRLIEDGSTTVVPEVSKVRSKVVRLNK